MNNEETCKGDYWGDQWVIMAELCRKQEKETKELREVLEAEKKDKMNVIKMAENLSEIVYQYIQWVTHNTNKQPDFQKCHEAKDAFNEYNKALNNNN